MSEDKRPACPFCQSKDLGVVEVGFDNVCMRYQCSAHCFNCSARGPKAMADWDKENDIDEPREDVEKRAMKLFKIDCE